VPAYLRGVFVSGKKKSYFVFDTESGYVHLFKKANDTKPLQTLSLQNGILTKMDALTN